MKKLQILVATMNRDDFSIVDKMNIQSDAIIANQCGKNEFSEKDFSFGKVTMISTDTKGVGINRNIAILASNADILLFADDDVTYSNDAAQQVMNAFEDNPKADVIIFSMDYTKNGEVIEKRHLKTKKIHLYNAMRYGACAMAVRRKSILKSSVLFNRLFGGGCLYSSGEDSLFLRDCFKKGLNIYTDEHILGKCSRDTSSWFTGCDEKFFYDKGALMRFLFPKLCCLMLLRFAICFKKETSISCKNRILWMLHGLKCSKDLKGYSEFLSEREKKHG